MKTFTNLAHWASKCASLGTINKKRYYLFFITMLLTLCTSTAWAESWTYTFTSKSWGDSESAWTSNKDGGQLTSGRGVQVSTTYSGASTTSKNEFNDVSRVVVVYSTNASKGAGTINVQIGSNAQKSYTVTTTGGTTDRNAELSFSPEESGKVKLTVNCTTNSIYIKSITIETSDGVEPNPEPGTGTGGETSTVTFMYTDLKGQGASSTGGDFTGATKESIFMSGKGNGNNSYVQIYANNYLTFTPTNATITRIVLTATTTSYIKTWKASEGTIEVSGDKATWTGNSTSMVTLTNTASAQARITQMDVTYTTSGSEEPEPVIVKTLKSIAVSGQKTTFEQGDIFKFDGTCIATYSVTKDGVALADETAEVTPASVSTPDMNTVGTQTVFVTYSEGGVEKTAEYTITITENIVTAGTYCTGKLGYAFWGLSAEKTTATANEVDYTRMFNDITINIKNGAKANAYFKEDHTRVYSGGYTMTFTAPVNYVITAISFTPDAGNNWAGTHTASVGTMTDSKNWTGSANEVTITFGGTCRITDICVSYEAAPVEPVKTLTSIEITTPATQTTFWQGETFNYDDLVVTAHYSDAEDEIITPTVTGSTATAGTATVTISYKEQSTSYAITVKAIPNTKETAYSVAEAFDIIDKLGEKEGIYITGTISQVDSYNSTYKSITYWISADGTTTNQLQVYSGKGLESADFSDKTDLSVGDKVIVCGNMLLPPRM